MKMISTKEYADARKISVAAVCKAIKKGDHLPGVIELGMFTNRHILFVESSFPDGITIGRPNKYVIKDKKNLVGND